MPTYDIETEYGTLSIDHDGDVKELLPAVTKWTAERGVQKALNDPTFFAKQPVQSAPDATYDPEQDLSKFIEPHPTTLEKDGSQVGRLTAKVLGEAARGTPAAETPVLGRIPYLPGKVEDLIDNVPNPAGIPHSVIARGVVDTANFFQTPLGIGSLGIGALPGAARSLIGGLFAAHAIKNAPEQVHDFITAETPEQKRAAGAALLESGMMLTPLAEAIPKRGGPRPAGATSSEISRGIIERDAERTPSAQVDDEMLDGWVKSRQAILDKIRENPDTEKGLSRVLAVVNNQLHDISAERISASAARIAQPAPPKGAATAAGQEIEAPPTRPTLFQQEQAAKLKEAGAPLTAEAVEKTALAPETSSAPVEAPAAAELTPAGEPAQPVEPAIKTPDGTVATGTHHVDAYQNAKETVPDTSGSQEGFVDNKTGEFISREEAAQRTGLPTTVEPGKLHSEDLKGKSPLEQLQALTEEPTSEPPSKFNPDDVNAYVSKVPEQTGRVVRDVLGKGKTVEDAASDNGVTVRKAQEMVDKANSFFDSKIKISPLAGRSYVDEPSVEARPDAPEIEGVKDWTSATEEVHAATPKMKRGGAEAGTINLPKFENRKMSELDQATTNRSAKMQRSFDEAKRAQTEINRVVPSMKRQAAISVYMEAGGDMTVLQTWESGAKQKWFREASKLAQTLTPEEIAIAKRVKAAFDVLKNRGIKFDVLNSGRDEYVPHVWDLNKGAKGIFGGGRLQEKLRFAKARTLDTFADGDAAGFTPKTLAIGKLLPAYLTEMNKVIADRQFVQDLSNGKANDGRPLVVPRGRVSAIDTDSGGKAYLANPDAFKTIKDKAGNPIDTSDYRVLQDHPALHDWRWEAKDENGNPIFMRDDLAVHPDTAKRINSMLGKSKLPVPEIVQKAQATMKREMFGLLAPFHQVQEGTHAIAHRVNPLFNIEPVDMRQPKFMDAARHGLMILPDRTSSASYMEGLGGKGTFLTQSLRWFGERNDKIANKAATAMANVVDGYQDYLFHKYIPALKFKTYQAIMERNMKVYDKELKSGTMTPADVKLTSAEQTNAAYGHLNLALMDRDPTTQHVLQLALLAPDFLEARSRFVGQAAKGLLGSKVGEEQFKALAFIALVQAGTAFTLSQLTGNKYDPKKPFSVVTKDREYTLRSVPEDMLRFGTDLFGIAKGGNRGIPFISARINPMLQSVSQYVTGRNYRGEKTDWKDTTEELLAKYIPITARSLPGVRQLTETSRNSPVSPMEQLAGSMGLKISRYSPISDTYVKAAEWMQKEGIENDRGSYPVSKYQQLRYALEDGDMDKAQSEYEKLSKKSDGASIAKGFAESVQDQFTKSNALDSAFANSLNESDKAIYDLAKLKRTEILERFNNISPTRARIHPDSEPEYTPTGRLKSTGSIKRKKRKSSE